MKNLNVYLTFPGTCRQALTFYRDAIGGEIISMQSFGESPVAVEDEQKDRIMHAEYRAEGIYLMASDTSGEQSVSNGTSIHLSINSDDPEEQARIFDRLAQGGVVTMPLQDTFWGARFGMLIDSFGIPWMFNCDLPSAE
jgi:PhnB protein